MAGTYAKYNSSSSGGGGGGGGIASINGDSTAAQVIAGSSGIGVSSSGGTTTITGSGFANTALSNLTSPTAINESLLFSPDATLAIGAHLANRPITAAISSYIEVGSTGSVASDGFSAFGQGTTYTSQIGGNTFGGFGDWAGLSFVKKSDSTAAQFVRGSFNSLAFNDLDIAVINYNGSIFSRTQIFGANGDFTTTGTVFFSPFATPLFSPEQASIFVGSMPPAAGVQNTGIGTNVMNSLTLGNNNVAIGQLSLFSGVTASSNTAIGQMSLFACLGGVNTAIGFDAGASITTGDNNTCIGAETGPTLASGGGNILLGVGADVDIESRNGYMVVGSATAITDAFFGSGILSATPAAFTLHPTSSIGTDIAAAPFNIAVGQGTGAGSDGGINFQVAPAGSSGTALNSLITAMAVSAVGPAVVSITSTTQALGLPVMTTAQKNAIAAPVAGLLVYDSDLNKMCIYTTAWETVTSA